jgi:hypothetical protein
VLPLHHIMQYKFHLQLCHTGFKTLLVTLIISSIFSVANAQHRQSDALTYGGGGGGYPDPNGWGITVNGGYDATTGDMRGIYGGAPTYNIGVVKSLNDFTFNGNIGYVSYKPKVDTDFIYADNTTVGYIKYDNFNSLELYLGAAYNVEIADQAKLYFGLNFGTYFNSFKYDAASLDGSFTASASGKAAYFAPKVGINFIISSHWAFAIEGRYNVEAGSSSSSTDTEDASYSYSISSIKTFTVSGGFTYYF